MPHMETMPNPFSLAFRSGNSGLLAPRARWYTFKSVGPGVRRLSLLGLHPITIQLATGVPNYAKAREELPGSIFFFDEWRICAHGLLRVRMNVPSHPHLTWQLSAWGRVQLLDELLFHLTLP